MPLTTVYVADEAPQAPWLRALIRMAGLGLVSRAEGAQVVVGGDVSPARDGNPPLRMDPGYGFGVSGRTATYDTRAVAALGTYSRERRHAWFGGHGFSAPVDACDHNHTVAAFVRTLFTLLLDNGEDAVFLWWFPAGAPGVVNFRIDVDDNHDHSLARMVDRLEPHLSWCSFYLTTSPLGTEPAPMVRAARGGAEIGSHFHHHYTFQRDPLTNRRNAAKSIDWLRQQGMAVSGLVTPSAKSFPGIADLLRGESLTYTSNFGALFDCLPLEWDDGGQRYLEVPIHPVAPGNLRKGMPRGTPVETLDSHLAAYYDQAAEALARACLPVFLYAHTNDCLDLTLLPRLLDRLRAAYPHHAFVRLDDYAAFWRQRLEGTEGVSAGLSAGLSSGVARLSPRWPGEVRVTTGEGERRWPFSLVGLLQTPTVFTHTVEKPKLTDRLRDRYELENVLPVSALALSGREGWVSLAYKFASRCVRLFRP